LFAYNRWSGDARLDLSAITRRCRGSDLSRKRKNGQEEFCIANSGKLVGKVTLEQDCGNGWFARGDLKIETANILVTNCYQCSVLRVQRCPLMTAQYFKNPKEISEIPAFPKE
jgi:hypothetical protein